MRLRSPLAVFTRAVLAPALLAVGLAVATPLAPARAEDVVTKVDGARLRGEVIQETPEFVKIKTAGGVITIPREEVVTVERAKDLRKELVDRRADVERAPSAGRWIELARWCQDRDLWADAIDCFWKVVKLDPDHKDARFELGFRRLDGKWLTEGEYFKAKGYVRIDGRWVSPEDKEKIDAGLVRVGDEWLTKEQAEARRARDAAAAEAERRGVPGGSKGGDSSEPAAPAKPAAAPQEPQRPRGPDNPLGRRPRGPDPSAKGAVTPEERKANLDAEKAAGGWKLAVMSKHYDFFSNGTVEDVNRLAQAMDTMCEEYKKIFAYKDEIGRPFPIWLYADQREFQQKTGKGGGVLGFYDGERIVAFHSNRPGGMGSQNTLFHEGTHQFENLMWGDNMWGAQIWLIEGLAVYFESSELEGKTLRQSIPYERLRDVQRAITANDYVHLSDLIRMEQAQFGALHYAHAWSLIHFLCWGTKGGKERFKAYCDGVKEGKDGVKFFEELFNKPIDQIEAAWKDYVRNLK